MSRVVAINHPLDVHFVRLLLNGRLDRASFDRVWRRWETVSERRRAGEDQRQLEREAEEFCQQFQEANSGRANH